MRAQGGDNFCPPGYGKVNRGIRVKPKTGFRCLEEAAVGEFSPSEEGSKPLCLISSHSKVFLELRHGTGTGPPFQPTCVGRELSFCIGTGEKSLSNPGAGSPSLRIPSLSLLF